ncbi:MAG: hypothetical protein WA659_01990 [Candidatus Aquirickettsiella sp.]
MLNFSKSFFLNAHRSYQLQGTDIDRLIRYYLEKEYIKIIKNGKNSPKLLAKKRQQNLLQVAPILEKLQDPQKKYATYLQLNFLPPGETKQNHLCISTISPPFWKEYFNISRSIKNFILPSGKLKAHLSNGEITKLNETCEEISCKSLLDKQIEYNIQSLHDICLDKVEVRQEVEAIRKSLKHDEQIGYIFTNNIDRTREHIECLVLTQGNIVKPITWDYFVDSGISRNSQLLKSDFNQLPLYTPDLSYFNNVDNPIKKLPHPQADQTSCGTLCLSFLKKLLKNDAYEWKVLTLIFSFYDSYSEKKYFFLPSPSLMLYSQSSKYIDFLNKIMLEINQTAYIEAKNQNAKPIWTIQGILNHSINQAKILGDDDMIKHNLEKLNELTLLRPRWRAASKQVSEKRKEMDDPGSNKNLYLMYKTKHFERISFFQHQANSTEKPENFSVIENNRKAI